MELSLLLKIIRLLTRFLLHHGLDLKIFESLWKIVFWEAVRNTLAISLMKLFRIRYSDYLSGNDFEMRDGHLKSDSDNFLYSALFLGSF